MLDLIFSGLEAFGTIIGAYFIVKQIALTRENNDKNQLIQKKETTLNAYSEISDNMKECNEALKEKFNLKEKNNDSLSREDILILEKNPELMKELEFIFKYLVHITIGIKNDIYDYDIIVSISGRWLVRLFDRYKLYIVYMRENHSDEMYYDTEKLIERIRKEFMEQEIKGESNSSYNS